MAAAYGVVQFLCYLRTTPKMGLKASSKSVVIKLEYKYPRGYEKESYGVCKTEKIFFREQFHLCNLF
jgi:hypothetical protein